MELRERVLATTRTADPKWDGRFNDRNDDESLSEGLLLFLSLQDVALPVCEDAIPEVLREAFASQGYVINSKRETVYSGEQIRIEATRGKDRITATTTFSVYGTYRKGARNLEVRAHEW